MAKFKIIPVRLGHSENDASFTVAKKPIGSKIYHFGHGCIVLKNNETGEVSLVDTSMAHWTEAEANDLPYRSNVEKGPTLAEGLATVGVKPEDVKKIFITHLHQDHCWNLGIFPKNTPIYVQRKELTHAVAPYPPERKSYSLIDRPGCPCWATFIPQFVVVDGDYEVEPGLKILFTPGHTCGSQSVLVDTEKGQYICVGDLYYTEENYESDAVTGWYFSLEDWYNSHEKVKATGATPLSIHMISIFDHESYG